MGRRLFLGGLASAAAVSPFARASRALAGGTPAPKRLVIWHTPAGTVVRVRAQRTGDEIVMTVEDYSSGLSETELERVFAKFHRGTVEGGGTDIGLGLAICRAIVRLHRGRAWAERVPGGGTAFRFTLPVDEAPSAPSEARPD
jgi:two-component system sensor histidine kinase KdpD